MGEVTAPGCLPASAAAGAAAAAAAACATGAGIAARDRARAARDADAHAFLLDFELGQPGLLQELGEFADQVLIDIGLGFGHAQSVSINLWRS